MTNLRIGNGYDVHALREGLLLVLGGVSIKHNKGLVAHSDGDVLTHALCDAILGAAALGDIGLHFPDISPEYKDVDSMILLEKCVLLAAGKKFRIVNADCTIIAQSPKMQPYINRMRENLARVMKTDMENVSVKATTTERLGFTGREEGIAALATVLIEKEV